MQNALYKLNEVTAYMNITILDRASFGNDTPIDALNKFGKVDCYESTSPELIVERCEQSDVLVLNKVKITADVIRLLPKLRLICVFATGYDNIDVNAAKEHGVAVCNVPGYSSESVALFTVSTVLSLVTHLQEYSEYVKSGEYSASGIPNRLIPVYHEIAGKTWGVVGYGGIGSAVGRIATALGAKVIVNKRTPSDKIRTVDIEKLCRESDIITLHCPLNDGTRELISASMIEKMKDGVIIVNSARGGVVNEKDIRDAVISGKIGGFGSDVYTTEPFSVDHPYYSLLGNPKVILTPHAAWGAYEARVRCMDIVVSNIEAFINEKIQNRVDI